MTFYSLTIAFALHMAEQPELLRAQYTNGVMLSIKTNKGTRIQKILIGDLVSKETVCCVGGKVEH